MRWSTRIEIDQADDRNAGGLESEDICGGERVRPLDPCRETVCGRELSQHDRGRFIDEATSGHAEDGMFTQPFGRQVLFADNG